MGSAPAASPEQISCSAPRIRHILVPLRADGRPRRGTGQDQLAPFLPLSRYSRDSNSFAILDFPPTKHFLEISHFPSSFRLQSSARKLPLQQGSIPFPRRGRCRLRLPIAVCSIGLRSFTIQPVKAPPPRLPEALRRPTRQRVCVKKWCFPRSRVGLRIPAPSARTNDDQLKISRPNRLRQLVHL